MLSQIRNIILLPFLLLSGYGINAQAPAPAAYPNDIPVNFVRVWEARAPQTNPNKILSTSPLDSFLMTTQYFDGLGRPLQTVVKGITPSGRDLVTPVLYDEAGRVQLSYLSFAANSAGGNSSLSDGQFKYNPFEQDSVFYSSSNPQSPVYGQQESWIYSHTVYEPSPLNRVSASYAPGNNWVGAQRGVARQYLINTVSDSVRIWEPDSTISGLPSSPGCYGAGQLYKNVSIDENDKQVVEYVDKQGRVLLKKLQLADTPGTAHVGWLCTYYVYDDLSNLRFVIPPAAVEALLQSGSFSMSNAIRDGYCFYYGYDCRQRMVCKKVPGASEVWMVYDKRDRLCMTQDGNMRADTARWLVTLYDDLNRPVASGLWTDGHDRAYHDSLAAAGSAYYYPFQSPPASNWELLTQTGYDDYDALPSGAPAGSLATAGITPDQFYTSGFNTASTGYAQPITQSLQTMGLVTWSAVRVLGTSDFLYTVNIYDEKGRVIQTKATNITGGNDVTTMQYDFSGKLLRTQTRQEKGGSSPHYYQLLTKNHYDAAGRLLSVSKQVSLDNETPAADKTIVAMRYDELGQLSEKTLGAGLDSLQYDYNIRGWLLGANRDYARQEGSSDHYFGFDLGYDKTAIQSGSGTIGSYSQAAYNGNIAGMLWKSAGDGAIRKYDFSYDAVNRLTQAAFTQYSAGNFDLSAGIDFSISGISYDANGNILQLSRRGWKAAGSSYIDSLLYSYDPTSNRLRNVIDRVNDPQTLLGDFRSSALYMTALGTKTTAATDYNYDANGNMIRDLNKDIGSATTQGIRYNYLNLPREITVYKTADSSKAPSNMCMMRWAISCKR